MHALCVSRANSVKCMARQHVLPRCKIGAEGCCFRAPRRRSKKASLTDDMRSETVPFEKHSSEGTFFNTIKL